MYDFLTLVEKHRITDEELAFLRARRLLTPRQRAMIDYGVFGVTIDIKAKNDRMAKQVRGGLRLISAKTEEVTHG